MQRTFRLLLCLGFTALSFSGCSTTVYRYHAKVAITDCAHPVTQTAIEERLVKDGFYRASQKMGIVRIFQRPVLTPKGPLAAERWELTSGEIGVVACPSSDAKWVVVEETRSCTKSKDCTKNDQQQVVESLKRLGCKVDSTADRGVAFMLSERTDWTDASCGALVKDLEI